jgi:hypothetical protein
MLVLPPMANDNKLLELWDLNLGNSLPSLHERRAIMVEVRLQLLLICFSLHWQLVIHSSSSSILFRLINKSMITPGTEGIQLLVNLETAQL